MVYFPAQSMRAITMFTPLHPGSIGILSKLRRIITKDRGSFIPDGGQGEVVIRRSIIHLGVLSRLALQYRRIGKTLSSVPSEIIVLVKIWQGK